MLRQGTPAPEFPSVEEMRAHYRTLNARLWSPPAAPKQTEASSRSIAVAHQERLAREERERLEVAIADQARTDELVFQVLDPEQLAREPKRIIARVAREFGLTYADIVGPSRMGPVVRARHAAIAAVREAHPSYSLPRIGRLFGGRDHTTILSALRKMAKRGVPQPPTDGLAR